MAHQFHLLHTDFLRHFSKPACTRPEPCPDVFSPLPYPLLECVVSEAIHFQVPIKNTHHWLLMVALRSAQTSFVQVPTLAWPNEDCQLRTRHQGDPV